MHTTIDKAKFKKLQRRLKTDLKSTVGILELLWRAACLNAPAGDIGKMDNEMIAIECDWQDDPDVLVKALLECGWLDECETHRLLIHDWPSHAPNFIRGNLSKHGKKFAESDNSALAGCSKQAAKAGCSKHGALSTVPPNLTKPNLTEPNVTQPNQTEPNGTVSADADRRADVTKVFEFYLDTGKQTGSSHNGAKLTADRCKLIREQLKSYSVEELCRAIYGCHHSPNNIGQNERGTKYLDLKHCIGSAERIERNWQFHNGKPAIRSQRELVNQSAMERFING